MTRAPGMMPRMSPVGMRNNFSPEKPTTSASTCLPSAVSSKQRPPTAASQPTASMVMPTMRLNVPSTTISLAFDMRSRADVRMRPIAWSAGIARLRACHAQGCRSVPISSLKMAARRVSNRASMRDVVVVIWHPPRAITGSSTNPSSLAFGGRQMFTHHCGVLGVQMHTHFPRSDRERCDGVAHDADDLRGIGLQFAAHDLPRQGHGQRQQFAFHLGVQYFERASLGRGTCPPASPPAPALRPASGFAALRQALVERLLVSLLLQIGQTADRGQRFD
jgi:hypothetical protein